MKNRIHYLDGIRGIAVLVVIFGHLRNLNLVPSVPRFFGMFLDADFGVNIFFVLSGFLITGLLRGRTAGDTIPQLRAFYLRRFFKLWPPLLVFVTITAIVDQFTGPGCSIGNIGAAATLTTDLVYLGTFPASCAKLAHTWSLTIEEIFYLVWAPTVFFFRRPVTICFAAALFLFSIPASTLHWAQGVPSYSEMLSQYPNLHIFSRMGSIAAGAILSEGLAWPWFSRWSPSRFTLAVLLGLGTATLTFTHFVRLSNAYSFLVIPFRYAIDSAFVVILIFVCVKRPGGFVARTLSFSPLRWVGLVSYSLYLWQQFFTHYTATYDYLYVWQLFPQNLIFMFGMASLSFYLVENPFQRFARARWKNRSLGINRDATRAPERKRRTA